MLIRSNLLAYILMDHIFGDVGYLLNDYLAFWKKGFSPFKHLDEVYVYSTLYRVICYM